MRCAAPLYVLLLLTAALALPACDSDTEERTVARSGDTVMVAYEGRLTDGRVFDRSSSARFPLNDRVISGFRDAVIGMRVGESKTVTIPPDQAYGANPPLGSIIPPDATLIFDITLLDIVE